MAVSIGVLGVLGAFVLGVPAAHAHGGGPPHRHALGHRRGRARPAAARVKDPSRFGGLKGWPPGAIPGARRTLAAGYRPPGEGPVKVAFFDADSTLRVSRSGNVSANSVRDVEILPGVAAKITALRAEGYLIAVVSNQGGVAAGFVTLEVADGALAYMCRLLARRGAYVDYYDFAEAKDRYRKPKAGMADEFAAVLARDLGREVDWRGSLMVGDSAWKRKKDVEPDGTPGEDFSNSDRGFAETVRRERGVPDGFRFYHPRTFFGWEDRGVRNFRKIAQVRQFRRENPDF